MTSNRTNTQKLSICVTRGVGASLRGRYAERIRHSVINDAILLWLRRVLTYT